MPSGPNRGCVLMPPSGWLTTERASARAASRRPGPRGRARAAAAARNIPQRSQRCGRRRYGVRIENALQTCKVQCILASDRATVNFTGGMSAQVAYR